MEYALLIEFIGGLIDLLGVLAIVWGILYALIDFIGHYLKNGTVDTQYETLRRHLGRTIIIGLEILIAGDIVRSIAVPPSFTNVGVLAIVVIIRAFLSIQIENGSHWRLPGQHKISD